MTTCEHCDGSLPHEHLDVGAVVGARRRALLGWSAARLALLAVLAAVVAALTPATARPAWGVLLGGAAAWVLVTVTAVLVAGLAHQRQPSRPAEAHLALAALAAGALTPSAALAVTLLPVSAAAGWAGAWSALGWLAAAGAADVGAALRTRSLLGAPGPGGEHARAAAVRARTPRDGRALVGTLATAAAFGGWVALLSLVPLLVLVAVPLHVAVVALLARRVILSRAPAAAATLRG